MFGDSPSEQCVPDVKASATGTLCDEDVGNEGSHDTRRKQIGQLWMLDLCNRCVEESRQAK